MFLRITRMFNSANRIEIQCQHLLLKNNWIFRVIVPVIRQALAPCLVVQVARRSLSLNSPFLLYKINLVELIVY